MSSEDTRRGRDKSTEMEEGPLSRVGASRSITSLPTKHLRESIPIQVERDDGGFIAKSAEFRLYGFGASAEEAIRALKTEIEALYDDLLEDDEFTDDWLEIRTAMERRIENGNRPVTSRRHRIR
jgi:predicted RNase H-like HicB family nuclease